LSALATPDALPRARRGGLTLGQVQLGLLWLTMFGSCIVFVEPSPYEVLFALTAISFLGKGLRFPPLVLPLLFLLLLYNIGGLTALIPFLDEPVSIWFVVISIYLAITSIFYCALMQEDALRRLAVIRSGFIASAVLASIPALLGVMDVAGLSDTFARYGSRATGFFKDPNVLGPFLVLPIVFLAQGFLTGERGGILRMAIMLLLVAVLFLTFSRGAWGNLALSLMLLAGLTLLTSPSARLKARVAFMAMLGLGLLLVLLAAIISIDSIGDLFLQRAKLVQDYDGGSTGRFGNQLRSLRDLLGSTIGYGPARFRLNFPEDPHNVYLNAFASYGWLGGIAYFALVAVTMVVGWRLVLRRSSLQSFAIPVWAVLFSTLVQGFQIDTDHWRHLYLMLGLVWGMAAYAERERRLRNVRNPAMSSP
jgi:O-antigen ligase